MKNCTFYTYKGNNYQKSKTTILVKIGEDWVTHVSYGPKPKYIWNKFKAIYARTPEDFYNKFIPIKQSIKPFIKNL